MLRKTPLMALKSEWIDLPEAWLDVPRECMKGKGSGKRPLSVPLCGWAVEQLSHRVAASGYVWPNLRSGRPVGNLTHMLDKIAEAAKVPYFSIHDLRATGNTWLANAGVDVRLRQYLMGHADGGPVINRYTKVTTDTVTQLREAVAVFDDLRAKKEKNVRPLSARRSRGR
jgi:integrase